MRSTSSRIDSALNSFRISESADVASELFSCVRLDLPTLSPHPNQDRSGTESAEQSQQGAALRYERLCISASAMLSSHCALRSSRNFSANDFRDVGSLTTIPL